MRNQFQKILRIFPVALLTMTVSQQSYSVIVPSAFAVEGGNQTPFKTNAADDLTNIDAQVQKVIAEMTFEQARHQEKVEAIKRELRSIVKAQGSQDKNWMPAKIAMVLDQESK